jgi:dihydrofolate reductase
MGKLIISQNVTLDGVVQDPTGDEGLGAGNWTGRLSESDRREWARVLYAESLTAEALLLGRRSDAWFAARWLGRTGDWADRLNSMPKYVVSSTIRQPAWTIATVLNGDVVDEVSKLKRELSGDIVVYGSIQLAKTLIEHELADELRLMTYPVVVGTGERLLGPARVPLSLRLVTSQTVGDSLVLLTYAVDHDAAATRSPEST